MLWQLAGPTGDIEHDLAVRELSAVSGRLAYALMCLAVTWGVLTAAGWINRLTGRPAVRGGHLVLSTLALAFVFSHVMSLLFLRIEVYTWWEVLVPFNGGVRLRHTFGILAFEGMLAAAIVVGARRWLSYRQWLGIHRLAYPAFGLGVLHAFLGAFNDGSLSAWWLVGITLLVPVAVVTALRFLPSRALTGTGLFDEAP